MELLEEELLVEDEFVLPQSLEQLSLFSPISVEHFPSPQKSPFPDVVEVEDEGDFVDPLVVELEDVVDDVVIPLVELDEVVEEVVIPPVEVDELLVEELEQSQIKQPFEPVFKEQP